jgi:hypothetical protein
MRILCDTTGEQVLKQQNSTGKAQEILNYMFALHVVSKISSILGVKTRNNWMFSNTGSHVNNTKH